MSRQGAVAELAGLAEDQMSGTSSWPAYADAIAALALPAPVAEFQARVAASVGASVETALDGWGWFLMLTGVFVPGSEWRNLRLDESIEFSGDVARGLKLMGATAVVLTFGPRNADFQLSELV